MLSHDSVLGYGKGKKKGGDPVTDLKYIRI